MQAAPKIDNATVDRRRLESHTLITETAQM